MKRVIKYIILLCIVLLFTIIFSIVSFAENNSINGLENIDEVFTNEEMIIEDINSVVADNENMIITADDMDYTKALKVFINKQDLLTRDSLSLVDMQNEVLESSYVYYLPVQKSGNTLLVTISKGKPVTENARKNLSENEISYLESLNGKWFVAQISAVDSEIDFNEYVNEKLKENHIAGSQIYYLGGLVRGIPLMAAVFTEDGDLMFLNLNNIYNYESEPEQGDYTRADFLAFEELKIIAEENVVDDELIGSGSVSINTKQVENEKQNSTVHKSDFIIIIPCVIIFIIVATLFYIYKRRNKNEKQKND